MPSPFETYDLNKALTAFAALRAEEESDGSSEAYYEGDHWQDGAGWRGPQFTGSDPAALIIKQGVARDFTSQNVSRGIVRRHRRGVVGRPPGWIVSLRRPLKKTVNEKGEVEEEKPTAEEQALLDEASNLILLWWDAPKPVPPFRAFKKLVTDKLVSSRGLFRFYVPPAEFVNGQVPVAPPEESIKRIHLLAPSPSEAAIVTDVDSMRQAGIYVYTVDGHRRAELCYVDDDGQTVVRILDEGAGFFGAVVEEAKRIVRGVFSGAARPEDASTWRLPLGGRLLHIQIEGEALITKQTKQNQALIAKGLTMLSHNMDLAGFRERVYFNTQPPGTTIEVDDPQRPGQKIKTLIPAAMPVGAGTRAFLRGIEVRNKNLDGSTTTNLTTPSAHDTDPIPTESFENTALIGKRNILEDADQLFVMISGDATSSGEAKKQARDDYGKSLNETGSEVNDAGTLAFETLLALTAYLSGEPGRYDSLRVTCITQIDPGPLSADDRRLNIEEKRERLRSRENAMEQIGIDDPDAMRQKIQSEEAEDAEALRRLPVPDDEEEDEEGDAV